MSLWSSPQASFSIWCKETDTVLTNEKEILKNDLQQSNKGLKLHQKFDW